MQLQPQPGGQADGCQHQRCGRDPGHPAEGVGPAGGAAGASAGGWRVVVIVIVTAVMWPLPVVLEQGSGGAAEGPLCHSRAATGVSGSDGAAGDEESAAGCTAEHNYGPGRPAAPGQIGACHCPRSPQPPLRLPPCCRTCASIAKPAPAPQPSYEWLPAVSAGWSSAAARSRCCFAVDKKVAEVAAERSGLDFGGRLRWRHGCLTAAWQVQDPAADASWLRRVVAHPHARRAALQEHRLRRMQGVLYIDELLGGTGGSVMLPLGFHAGPLKLLVPQLDCLILPTMCTPSRSCGQIRVPESAERHLSQAGRLGVERGGGLVQQQHVRLQRHRDRDDHPLRLATLQQRGHTA